MALARVVTFEGITSERMAQLKQEIEKRVTVRKQAQTQIDELNKQRAKYLKDNAAHGEGGFDAKVNATVDHQLK